MHLQHTASHKMPEETIMFRHNTGSFFRLGPFFILE